MQGHRSIESGNLAPEQRILDEPWPRVGTHVEFRVREGGQEKWIAAEVVRDIRSDATRVALRPLDKTPSGGKPAIRIRNRSSCRALF